MTYSKDKKIKVIALGGNQLSPIGFKKNPGITEQLTQMKKTANLLVSLFSRTEECNYVITHGNGPQVGNINLAFEIASAQESVPKLPLYMSGAMSQGMIGYIIQTELQHALDQENIKKKASSIITRVLVSKDDPAFENPTKYVGQGYTETYIKNSMEIKEKRETLKGKPEFLINTEKSIKIFRLYEGSPELGIYREVVASPLPKEIIEIDSIISLINSDIIPIAVGGGGIPVIKEEKGYSGVNAVIDKDLATALLASELKEKFPEKEVELIILTGSNGVYLDFGNKTQKILSFMTPDEARQYINQGHFPAGSMLPKIEAAIYALEKGIKNVYITSPEDLEATLKGEAGTRISLTK